MKKYRFPSTRMALALGVISIIAGVLAATLQESLTTYAPPGPLPEERALRVVFAGMISAAGVFALGLLVLCGVLTLRAQSRRLADRCEACRYERAGLPLDAPCPECGAESPWR